MKKLLRLLITSTVTFSTILAAQSANALTVTLDTISPEATDLSEMFQQGAPDDVTINGWLTTPGTEYTATYSVDEQPAVVVNPGGQIEVGGIAYDADAGTLAVTFTATGIVSDFQLGSDVSIIGLVAATESLSEDGPPAEMRGAFMSTNVQEWELIPPSPENPAFGFVLTGPAGEEGFFRMLIPDAVVDLLSEFSGVELQANDLAVVMDDQIATLSISDVEGGYLVDINVTFEADNTQVAGVAASDETITREVVVEKQPVLSLALAKQVSAGKTASLKGYLNLASGKNKGKTLELYRKRGNGKYTLVDTKKVKDSNGKVEFTKKVTSKTDKYNVKYKKAGSAAQVSNIVTVEAL